MTKEEIRKFLDNTKVYVNGKSKEIQEKLFSFGYKWICGTPTEVRCTEKPFLFIYDDGDINYASDMCKFTEHKYREITADEILSLEITDPSYRPFKDKDECWNEMLKHQPFGWVKSKDDEHFSLIGLVQWMSSVEDVMVTFTTNQLSDCSVRYLFNEYIFADGTPFGIKD